MRRAVVFCCGLVGAVVVAGACYYDTESTERCCEVCDVQRDVDVCACGDQCIPCDEACNEEPGCACNP